MDSYSRNIEKNYVNGHDWQQTAYENLANAIIESACNDYLNIASSHCVINKNSNTSNMRSLMKFFYSEWFACLTNIDPDYLVSQLDQKALIMDIERVDKIKDKLMAKVRKEFREKGYSDNDAKIIGNEILLLGFEQFDARGRAIGRKI